MYSITDKKKAIRLIQRYVGLTENGVYDKRVRDAVVKFQEEMELSVSGEVDYNTFVYLRDNYKAGREVSEYVSNMDIERYPYSRGDYGEHIRRANADMGVALLNYTHERPMPRGGVYDASSEAAAIRLGEIYGIPSDGRLGEILHARILREILTST